MDTTKKLLEAVSNYVLQSNQYETRARQFEAALQFGRINDPKIALVFDGWLEIVRQNPQPLDAPDAEYREYVALGQRLVGLARDVARDSTR